MKIHRMQLPREVIVGQNVLNQTGKIIKTLGFSGDAIAVTGPKVSAIISEPLENSLERESIKMDYVTVNESILKYVNQVEKKIEEKKPACVLGVGGGKDIDVAKLGSANKGIPFISIPTAASHDGIASSQASIKGFKKPYSIKAQTPVAIIADTSLIVNSPYRLTASGCGDIVAKYVAVKDWELASKIVNEYYGDYAANLALMSAKLVMKSSGDVRKKKEVAIRTVVEALISCGVAMSIAGSSRPCSGSEHMFAHALDLTAPNKALHGEKCAIGTIMCAYLQKRNWKMVRKVLKMIGTPTKAEEINVSSKDIVKALIKARKIRPDRYTILSIKKLDQKMAEDIAKATFVIE